MISSNLPEERFYHLLAELKQMNTNEPAGKSFLKALGKQNGSICDVYEHVVVLKQLLNSMESRIQTSDGINDP
jgi:hypothetical protein